MKIKKLVSVALALVMALSLAVPAFAADTVVDNSTDAKSKADVAISGDINLPTISVTVPQAGDVIVNPYQLEYEITAAAGGNPAVTDNSQIVSVAQYLDSTSDVPLKVNVDATGSVATGGAVTFATASTQGKTATTTKSVFMYFEIVNAENTTDDPSWAGAYNAKNNNQILIGTDKVSKTALVTLPAVTETVTNTYAAFHLAGDACSTPETAWAAADKVNVALVFTFTPVMNEITAE